ncbi:fibronectin type III domain-containing protein [Rarobacter incanus]|uniref:Fibronectin type III domain protein n=1 Tax=Rarobacter incanus TaxID=153494 RepID=A0A542SMY7_9MICO|nr:fibronectin type III domain-containing protein [Rarobacter incanus]TQK75607.1 fibronectin type III domain protein [Rarobacter incanus]
MIRLRIRALLVATALIVGVGVSTAHAETTPPAPTGLAVAAGNAGAVTFTWTRTPGASAYKIEATIVGTATTLVSETTYSNSFTTTKPIGDADGAREIRWHVASFGSGTTISTLGDWSEWSTFTPDSLAVPTLQTPADAATVTYPNPVVFSWEPVAGARLYRISYIAGEFGGSGTEVVKEVTSTSFTPAAPLAGDEYYSTADGTAYSWRIQALLYDGTSGSTAWSSWSAVRQVAVNWPATASQPTLVAPTNAANSSTITADPVFTWQAVAGASSYKIEYSKNQSLDSATTATVTGTSYVPTSALTNGNHYWRVTAIDAGGSLGTPSQTWQFYKNLTDSGDSTSSGPGSGYEIYPTPLTGVDGTVARVASDMTLYNPAQIIAGGGGMTIEDFALRWTPIPRATLYEVEVSSVDGAGVSRCYTASTEATIIIGVTNSGTESGLLSGAGACLWNTSAPIETGGTYRWRVRAVNYDANATTGIQSTVSDSAITSDWSDEKVNGAWARERWITITDSDAARSSSVTIDLAHSGEAQLPSTKGESAPEISWSAFDFYSYVCSFSKPPTECTVPENETAEQESARIKKLLKRTVYEVRIYAKGAGSSTEVAYARTPSTHIRINGVFDDNQVSEPYSVAVRPIYFSGTPSASGTYTDLIGLTAERFVWTKSAAALDTSPAPLASEDGTVLLRWKEQSVTAPNDGGSRGYAIKIFTAGGTQLGTTATKIEYPFYIAQNPQTRKPLAPGQYSYSVAPLNANGAATKYSETKTFTIDTPAPGVTKTASNVGGSIALTWTPTTASSKYKLRYRVVGGDTWTQISSSAGADIKQTAVTLSDLATGRYEWQVSSIDTAGNASAWSESDIFVVSESPVDLLTATNAVLNATDANLTWKPVAAASRYLVMVSKDQTFSSMVDSVETVATSFATTKQLQAGTVYYWKVLALPTKTGTGNNRPNLGASETRTFTINTLPAAVKGAKVVKSGPGVNVSWQLLTGADAGTTGDLTYLVQYRVQSTSDDWTDATVRETTANATSWAISDLLPGTGYEFRVAAKNAQGQGAWSSVLSVATATTPAGAPGLKVDPALGKLTLRITSVGSSDTGGSPITGYRLSYKKSSENAWVSQVIPVSSTYVLERLSNSTSYDVSVAAINAVGDGPATVASASTLGTASPVIGVRAKSSDGSASITWKAPAQPNGTITGYVVEIKERGSATWRGATNTTSQSTTVAGLTNGVTYQIRVAARTSVGLGAYSSVASFTPAGVPVAPATVKAKYKKGKTTIKWKKSLPNGSKVKAYYVQYSTNSVKWKKIKKLKGTSKKLVTKKAAKSIKKGKVVYFRIVAQNSVGKSLPSASVAVTK